MSLTHCYRGNRSGRTTTIRIISSIILAVMLLLFTAGVTRAETQPGASATQPAETPQSKTIALPEREASLFEIFSEVKALIQKYHTKEVSDELLYQGAIRGMLEVLNDPYSQYLTQEQMETLASSLEGEYVGIGVTIELIDGNITVISTFSGSPAEKGGIKAGDVIIGADDKDLRGKTPQEASAILRGQEDTEVTVYIRRPSTGETLQLKMKRARIVPPTVNLKDLGNGIFYLQVSQFSTSTGRDFPVLMQHIRSRNPRGLILDLRGNPGGFLDDALAVAEELVPKGPIVELRRKDLKEVIVNDRDITSLPVAVLVNGGTASAAEIVAGAIRDRGVGILIGEPTFGKGCIQSLIPLAEDMGGVRLTIADYYTPAGRSLTGKGLPPDVLVEDAIVKVPAKVDYKRPLKRGLVGLDVLTLQESLKFLGYFEAEPDGVFGDATEEACIAFCKGRGLEYSGQMDASAIDALYLAVLEKASKVEDKALQKALECLQRRIESGVWLSK